MHALYEFPDSCTNKLTGVNDVEITIKKMFLGLCVCSKVLVR